MLKKFIVTIEVDEKNIVEGLERWGYSKKYKKKKGK